MLTSIKVKPTKAIRPNATKVLIFLFRTLLFKICLGINFIYVNDYVAIG